MGSVLTGNMQKPPRLQDYKIASMNDSQQRLMKNQTQEVTKTKDYKTNMTPTTPLYPPLPEDLVNEFSIEPSFHSERTTRP